MRLRYQMTVEDKARFLDAAPHLLDDVQAIDKGFGREPLMDWNKVSKDIDRLMDQRASNWKDADRKLFRTVFTAKHAGAEKVRKGKGFEPDPNLRDFENIPLKVDIDAFFAREVLSHVADAWMDRTKDKVGYEINFNRHFYKFSLPRPLAVIDAELKAVEEEILSLLQEVVE